MKKQKGRNRKGRLQGSGPAGVMLFVLISFLFTDAAQLRGADTVAIQVDTLNVSHTISPYLNGVCINTAHDTDERWANGVIIDRMKAMNTRFLRWPDTESSYHWKECPGAPAWKDSWETDPTVFQYFADKSVCASTAGMDVDEFIAVCREIGAEPLISVNFQSGWEHGRLSESLCESLELVQYCKRKNYGVRFWRIGNEPFSMTAREMAEVVNYFVPAMKKIDPDIKIIFNVSNHYSSDYALAKWDEFFALAGRNVDYADLHNYWRWTSRDDPPEYKATFQHFIEDIPITDKFKEWDRPWLSYTAEIEAFRERYGDYIEDIFVTEWNAGPLYREYPRSHFQAALIQCEMMIQYMKADLFAASRWPGTWVAAQGDRAYIDPVTLEPRPVHAAMSMFGEILEQKLIVSTSGDPAVPSLSAMSPDGAGIRVFILNKTQVDRPVLVGGLPGNAIINASTLAPAGMDIWSDDYQILSTAVENTAGGIVLTLPAFTFTMIEISRP